MDSGPQTITQTIAQRVALVTDTDPLALPPLSHTIESEAIGAAIDETREGESNFRHAGLAVAVDGTVPVQVTEKAGNELEQVGPETNN